MATGQSLTRAAMLRALEAAVEAAKADGVQTVLPLAHLRVTLLADAVEQDAAPAVEYVPVLNPKGQPLYVHACGAPRYGSVITGLVANAKCGTCFEDARQSTWRLVYEPREVEHG